MDVAGKSFLATKWLQIQPFAPCLSLYRLERSLQVMDFGYPQFTEAKILSEFIKTDAHKMEIQARPPMAVTNAVSWRSEGIKYKKNEVRW